MAQQILRLQLAVRGAKDLDKATSVLGHYTKFDTETGEFIGTQDQNGNPLIAHKREGAPAMNLEEVLDVAMKAHPELFGGQSQAPGRVSAPPAHNPFAKGPRFNLTEGMRIWNEDPELGRELMIDAGYDMGIKQ